MILSLDTGKGKSISKDSGAKDQTLGKCKYFYMLIFRCKVKGIDVKGKQRPNS